MSLVGLRPACRFARARGQGCRGIEADSSRIGGGIELYAPISMYWYDSLILPVRLADLSIACFYLLGMRASGADDLRQGSASLASRVACQRNRGVNLWRLP